MFTTILLALLLMPVESPNLERQAVELSQKGDYEASEKIFKSLKAKDQAAYDFYRLVNAFKLNKKKEVVKISDEIIYGFGVTYPQRYIDLARIMKSDAETWKHDRDDLDDIAREMDKITDRLKNNKGGAETQKIQKDVLARLDKMIKDAEDKQKAAQDAADKAEEDKNKEDGAAQAPQPAQDTITGQDRGLGEVDKKRIKEMAEVWGKLPEKDRAQAMRGLLRKLPAKDKKVIEAYIRELQKRSGK